MEDNYGVIQWNLSYTTTQLHVAIGHCIFNLCMDPCRPVPLQPLKMDNLEVPYGSKILSFLKCQSSSTVFIENECITAHLCISAAEV